MGSSGTKASRQAAQSPYRQTERLDVYRTHARSSSIGRRRLLFCSSETLEATARPRSSRPGSDVSGTLPAHSGPSARRVEAATRSSLSRAPSARRIVFDDIVRGRAFRYGDHRHPVLVAPRDAPTFRVVVDDALMAIQHVDPREDTSEYPGRCCCTKRSAGRRQLSPRIAVMGPDHSPVQTPGPLVANPRAGYLPEL